MYTLFTCRNWDDENSKQSNYRGSAEWTELASLTQGLAGETWPCSMHNRVVKHDALTYQESPFYIQEEEK